ncbi:MAG: hypothetical protein R3315_03280 [Woeseiaceae bacterium]|nr:hypothetical protein [Woeseiaceae bacterium]
MRALLVAAILLAACVAQPQRSAGPWTPPPAMQDDPAAFLDYLTREGLAWIRAERERLRPGAAELSPEQRAHFAAYFEPATLDAVRYRVVDRIDNPGFYADLARQGIDPPLDFTRMAGIAFIDTIAIARHEVDDADLTRLLFHEAVHVAQYRQLGDEAFMDAYVQGWAYNGFDYFSIPLEREAYRLEARFSVGEVFSVERSLAGTD